MSRFMCEKYSALEAYTPGEQPTDMRYIKLNTNESPFPPSDGVINAVNALELSNLRLYPDPECGVLRRKLASLYNVGWENIFVSNGSDDILNFSFMAFCSDGEKGVVFPDISYGFYKVYADLYRSDYRQIPLRNDFTVNVQDYIGIGKNIVLANPNAPTGIALGISEIERIVSSNPDNVVIIDEAYVDFGADSCYRLTEKYDNLLVVRTYSKSRSMAGARLGFAIGNKELIKDLEKIKFSTNPYNINRLTLVAGAAAIDDDGYYTENCRRICQIREYTKTELEKLGFTLTESKANFLFAQSADISGLQLYTELKRAGILIRHFTGERICNYNRITVGTREEMDAFLDAVREILEKERKKKIQ